MLWETIKNAAILVATLYGVMLFVLFLRQDGLVYYPDLPGREYEATPKDYKLPYENVALTTSDGASLAAWFVPAEHPRGTLLYVHGNAGNISHRLDSIRLFHDLGLSVLIFDYRGYGQSSGEPDEDGTYRDAEAAWQHLTAQRCIAPQHIVLFGESLGAAVAAHLAARHRPGALILASAFTSVPDLAADLYPLLPVRWITRYRYDTRRYLQDVHAPVLVAHSREDEIIPFSHGQSLHDAAHEPRQFLELRGGHNDLFFMNSEALAHATESFIGQHLPHRP
ncbi:MAG: lysophospholipase [Gallionellales bacterium GWA2_60_142]|nr:MAG: lysophospholipase [Gallionellales bacterium GWA2_60_142]HCI12722.1 alpha/beta hydrolase [Gallionellaceae bacterium]